MEKILIIYQESLIEKLYKILIENFLLLANDVNGLCVIKKMITNASKQETIVKIGEILSENSLDLIQNPFGNYALQIAFENWRNEDLIIIARTFYGKFYNLSMHKYSSNVIEKCLIKMDINVITQFVEEICIYTRVIGNYNLTINFRSD